MDANFENKLVKLASLKIQIYN